ncbi:hypothetical protein H0H93_014768 [Arthromyces matolae]|nr:hypothetical protein H0H93_014768 [Arthromyces matolae]
MKITLVNFLFLVMFALAASSTPVPPGQAHAPTAPSTRVKSGSTVTYTINGHSYTKDDIHAAAELLNMVNARNVSPSPVELVHAQTLFIEANLLEITDDPRLRKEYNKMQSEVHDFMVTLIEYFLSPTTGVGVDRAVLSLAHAALEDCLKLEKDHHYTYDDLLHIPGGSQPSLTDPQYLLALKKKLEESQNSH